MSLDDAVQQVVVAAPKAVEVFGDYNGALVAVDPRTGGILAFISKPGFNPNLFVEGISQKDYKVYVLVGDGELQEGQNWEAMMAASKWRLENLVVIVDRNGVQLDGTTEEIMPMRDIPAKMREFGFETVNCGGHDCETIHEALTWASGHADGPRAVICDTIKGKGVSFMEGNHVWHGKQIGDDEYEVARRDLEGGVA